VNGAGCAKRVNLWVLGFRRDAACRGIRPRTYVPTFRHDDDAKSGIVLAEAGGSKNRKPVFGGVVAPAAAAFRAPGIGVGTQEAGDLAFRVRVGVVAAPLPDASLTSSDYQRLGSPRARP
jgi:hypothetical protein